MRRDFQQMRIENVTSRYSMFPKMADYHKPEKGTRFEISLITATEEDCAAIHLRSMMLGSNEYSEFIPGEYVRLIDTEKQEMVMSDTPMEKKTNMEIYEKANGHVLIGGLGIGMILLAIQDKPEVTSITVVEKYQEIYDLVVKNLPLNDKVKIIIGNIFQYEIPKGMKYDVVYMDIWNNIDGENWDEYIKLNKKFAYKMNRANPNRWCNAWRKKDVQKLAYY